MLTNIPYILDLIRGDVSQLNFSWINWKLGKKRCGAGLSSAWDPRTLWLLKGVLKQELFGIRESTFFGVNTSKNIWAINVILFFKMCEISCWFWKCNKTLRNCFLVFKLIAFELVPRDSLNYEKNTCDQPSTC